MNSNRADLLTTLYAIARKLPNGLLHRLVEDAQFFHDWNLGKKAARRNSRINQHSNWQVKAEEKAWKNRFR